MTGATYAGTHTVIGFHFREIAIAAYSDVSRFSVFIDTFSRRVDAFDIYLVEQAAVVKNPKAPLDRGGTAGSAVQICEKNRQALGCSRQHVERMSDDHHMSARSLMYLDAQLPQATVRMFCQ